jgi:Concanavalin A-like lectin/glucanases superfamily
MLRCWQYVLASVLVVVGIITAADELTSQQKAPIPGEQAQAASQKAAGELYGGRFRQAKTAAEKTALATEMIDAALKVKDGSADQYVLLKIARDMAAGAGDAPTALRTVEKTVERFDVPGAKLSAETLQAAARKASTSSHHKTIAEAVLGVADAVADEGEYELALSLCELARAPAQKSKQFGLAKELTAKIDELKKRQRTSQEYRDALAVLETNPTEPAANLAAGRHLCLVQGDWDRGVPMLALGSDAELKAMATKDLADADSADGQAAIGDAWWAVAEKKLGSERDTLRLRAGFWYRRAVPNLAGGLAGLKIKQRLAELEKSGREVSKAPSKSPAPRLADPRLQLLAGAILLMTFEPETFTSKDGKVYVADLSGAGNHGIVEGAAQAPTGRVGAGLQFGGQGSVLLPTLHARLTQGLRQLSVSVWVRPADLKGDQFIFDVGDFATRSICLCCRAGEFVFVLPEDHGGKVLTASGKVEMAQWYHVVGVWNGAEQRIYVNGQRKAAAATPGLTLSATSVSGDPARIGTQAKPNRRSGRYFRGIVDEVAIFNRALSDEEIQTLFQLGLHGEPLVKATRTRSGR